MKRLFRYMIMLFAAGLLLLAPTAGSTQPADLTSGAPPVVQPLISEGDFAITLGTALGVITTDDDQIEAETKLGDLQIAPRNGWISDYPVTPDIIVELRNAVAKSADAGMLTMSRNDALILMDNAVLENGLAVRPYTEAITYEPSPQSCATYPNPADIRNIYAAEAPVVTYYCPPPDYYDMYAWVPSPFWWYDLWFPGYYILRDFHRVVHHHNRTAVIRNHFNDVRHNRAFRIDPIDRFKGRTYRGIGAPRGKDFISTGVSRSDQVIFNRTRGIKIDGAGTVVSPTRGTGRTTPATPTTRQEIKSIPAVRQEQKPAPVIRHATPAAPVIRHESPAAPVIRHESPAAPVIRHESLPAPVIRHEAPAAPAIQMAPAVREEQQSAPVFRQEQRSAPASGGEGYPSRGRGLRER